VEPVRGAGVGEALARRETLALAEELEPLLVHTELGRVCRTKYTRPRERIDCAADRLTGPALAQMLEDAADAGDIPTTST
jgi:hypothetical protein